MTLRGRIVEALTGVTNPRTGHTVIEEAAIRDLALTDSGKVRLTFLLAAQDPASLVRDVRHDGLQSACGNLRGGWSETLPHSSFDVERSA